MATSSCKFSLRILLVLVVNIFSLVMSSGCCHKNTTQTQSSSGAVFTVNGNVALASLISLSDGHLQKLADELTIFARSVEARSSKWSKIQGPLTAIAQNNIAAAIWFALPDGSYWTVNQGYVESNLADRAYWNKVIKGQAVVGDLVVSKSTGQNVAIIAIPVLRPNKTVVGVVGASIYLDKLSQQLKQEMDLDNNYIFYAIDSTTQVALNSNTSLIFTHPGEFGEEMRKVFAEMVTRQEGVLTYQFRNSKRTVLYQKSPTTNWWYTFGFIEKDGR